MKGEHIRIRTEAILFKLILIYILLWPISSFAGTYSGGNGSAKHPFKIKTAEDLNDIGNHPEDFNDCFILVNDINMAGYSYSTALIGAFEGVFDGNDCNISNLTIDTEGAGNDFLGLFGQIEETGQIKNLGVEDVNITGGNYSRFLGGLSGENYGTISNCYATGSVSGGVCLGGLCGSNDKGTINSSYATGSVSGGGFLGGLCGIIYKGTINNSYATGSVSGIGYIGGLCGQNDHGIISNCYADGFVCGSFLIGGLCGYNRYGIISNCNATGYVSGDNRLGGLIGENSGPVSDCYATGSISGGDSSYWLGGLCGKNNGPVSDCNATGSVTGGDSSSYLGGLCGYNDGDPISNCYATGSVTGGDGSCYLGGLCGHSRQSTISNCYATGSVTGGDDSWYLGGLCGQNVHGNISNCYATGSVTGHDYIGGLCGITGYGTISNSYATGSVSSKEGGCKSLYLGGLCGKNGSGTISNCWASGNVYGGDHFSYLGGLCGSSSGTISNCYATGSVTGGLYSYTLGGLCGETWATIENCYATGSVTGGDYFDYLGGLCGKSYGLISNSYFLDPNDGGGPDNGIGSPLTDTLMKQQSSFIGWDFVGEIINGIEDIWTICEGVDYPRLRWQYKVPVLDEEPETTVGYTNVISWEAPADANADVYYYAECAEDVNFTVIVADSGWVTETEYEFVGLNTGQRYWYRVKTGRCDYETEWSAPESSLQVSLGDAVDVMLEPDSMKNSNMKNALIAKIDAALSMIEAGQYNSALAKLENDILQKTDGCANSGEPDKNDWIITCEQQQEIYPLIIETIDYVLSLI